MARVISEADAADLHGAQRHFAYNGFDCCVTREVYDVLAPRLTPQTRRIYKYEMGCQAPAMAMMLRGVKVDRTKIAEAIVTLEADYAQTVVRSNALVEDIWDATELETGICQKGSETRQKSVRHKWPKGVSDAERQCSVCGAPRTVRALFNPNSESQAKHLFYELMRVPPQTNKKGEVSLDKECLEKIARKFAKVERCVLVVGCVQQARGIRKQVGVLKSGISTDGRCRSTFVVGGAWTGRWSSTASPFDEGTNLQNIAEKLRYIFVADPGMELFYADLEQAESCCVAHLAGDENYIAAHKSGDVHTYVSRLLWPDLPWTGDLNKDKKIASETRPEWDRDHDYRYNAKRIQHGSNYLLSSIGVARIAHIPQAASAEAQGRYFDAFPGIKEWHYATIAEQKVAMSLVSPAGRYCQFFGRPWDDHTKKQGVAFKPQSLVADILDVALWQVWDELDPDMLWLLAQVHDAILGEFRKGATIIRRGERITPATRLLELMRVPVDIKGIDGVTRKMTIGVEMKCGQNWSKYNADPLKGRINLEGLR